MLDRELGNWAYCLEGFAGLAGARGQGTRAARLREAAEGLRTNIGAPLPLDARLLFERSMAAARAQLGEAAWEEAFAQGMAMPAEEAAEYALSEKGAPAPASPLADRRMEGAFSDLLTRREKEVAALVARGLSNRRIAEELYLSERTIENHVSKILRKLDLASRTEISARATEQWLTRGMRAKFVEETLSDLELYRLVAGTG